MARPPRLLAPVVGLLVAACGGREEPDCEALERARTPHAARYVLAWEDDTLAPETTDLGYRVTLTGGVLVDYAVQLVPCTADELAALAVPLCGGTVLGAIPLGHGTSDVDDSRVALATVEPLLGDGVDFGQSVVLPRHYCRSHYLTGPATATTPGGEVGVTLRVEGRYLAPGALEEEGFVVETGSAWGAFAPLEEAGVPTLVDSGTRSVAVTVRRSRARLFDGVDWASATPEEAGRAALRNLVLGTRTTVATE